MKPVVFIIQIAFISLFTQCTMNPDPQNAECIKERDQLEANKKMVTEFYQQLFGDKNLDVIDTYIAENYIQHNPIAADGREALREILKGWFENAPKDTVDFQKVMADGDLVMLHVKSNFGGKPVSLIDIFRIENGMIAEHWDVIQEVPDKSANPHPMF